MSTDEPAGDEDREEEVWDEERIREDDELVVARGAWKLAAVALHVASGRLVAYTELLLAHDMPRSGVAAGHPGPPGRTAVAASAWPSRSPTSSSWRRGRRTVRLVVTGNAQSNAPMIAVNDLLGFEMVGAGMFWQKQL